METLRHSCALVDFKSLNFNPNFATQRTNSRQFLTSSSPNRFHKPSIPPINRLSFASNPLKVAVNSPHYDHDHVQLSRFQKGLIWFAKAIGWFDLADFLRRNSRLCYSSMALFLVASACPYLVPKSVAKSLQDAFIAIAFPLVGVPAALDALIDIFGGKVNIHVFIAIAAFASVFTGNSLEGGLLIAMFNLARIAEEYFTSNSMVDVRELKQNYADYALVLDAPDNKEPSFSDLSYKKVPVIEIDVGSFILVQVGEAVPVDCVVSQGRSTITIENLTGEVKPIDTAVGDSIPGGARNLDGMLIVKATKKWKESMLSKIVQLTEEAHQNKAKLQRWLDEFGERYSKVVMVLSVAVALLGPVIFKWPLIGTSGCRGSIYRGLGLMIAASPCALAVAPLAYANAIRACTRKGLLLKGGCVLDALASCHTIAFDKTGTLTTGKLKCKAIEPIHGHRTDNDSRSNACCAPNCEKEALAVAAAMEKGSTHPIGRAIVDHSTSVDLPSVFIESFESIPGRGLCATLSGDESGIGRYEPVTATLGSVDYIASSCKTGDVSQKIRGAVMASAYGNEFIHAALSVNEKVTLFHFEDEPRPGVSDVIAWLRNKCKFRVMMLASDHESSAKRVARAVDITEVYSGLKPEDKLNRVVRISRETGEGLIMVGDGKNNAPALAAATVSIVLAERATDSAIAVADVLLLQDNILGVPFSIAKARQTTSLVKQNVALALSAIIVASLLSVLGFLPLWLTVLLHEGGSLIVCLSSIRALDDPPLSLKNNLHYVFNKLIMQMWKQIPNSEIIHQLHNCNQGGFDIVLNTLQINYKEFGRRLALSGCYIGEECPESGNCSRFGMHPRHHDLVHILLDYG